MADYVAMLTVELLNRAAGQIMAPDLSAEVRARAVRLDQLLLAGHADTQTGAQVIAAVNAPGEAAAPSRITEREADQLIAQATHGSPCDGTPYEVISARLRRLDELEREVAAGEQS